MSADLLEPSTSAKRSLPPKFRSILELKPRKLLLKLSPSPYSTCPPSYVSPVFERVWERIRSASNNVSGLVFAHANINISTRIVRAIRVCLNRRDSPAFLPFFRRCLRVHAFHRTPSATRVYAFRYTRCFVRLDWLQAVTSDCGEYRLAKVLRQGLFNTIGY